MKAVVCGGLAARLSWLTTIRFKKQKHCTSTELTMGDCRIGLSLASSSGSLILAACVGRHTDASIEQLITNTEGKTTCKQFNPNDWGGYERALPPEIEHDIGKDKTQRLERTNGIARVLGNVELREGGLELIAVVFSFL